MIKTKQEKDKTTIVISRRLRKKELERIVEYISFLDIRPKKGVTKKKIGELADEINEATWKKFKKDRGI